MFHTNLFLLCTILLANTVYGQQSPGAAPAPGQQPPASTVQEPSNPQSRPLATRLDADLATDAWTMLERGAGSDKARERSDAVSALTILGRDPKSVSLIETALGDKEVTIRVLAATALGDIRARSAIPKLMDAVDDASPQVSFAAVTALWKMGDRSTRAILYEVLAGERKTSPGLIRGKMSKAMAEMHDPKSLALIGINQASGALLGPFSLGVSFIEEYTRNKSAPVQALCAQMLAADDSSETVEQLQDALSDKNWAVRAAAARAHARLGHPSVIPELKEMMQSDKEQPARFSAAAAIIRLSHYPGKARTSVSPTAAPKTKTD
jgi:HEAT repeat protein